MNITIMGLGYIGAVTSACLSKDHFITGVDIVKSKVDLINKHRSPIIEPQIDVLIKDACRAGRLKATYDNEYTLGNTEIIVICVGTPSNIYGEVDLTSLIHITKFLSNIFIGIEKRPAVIYRSTVPPGTMENIILPLYENHLPSIDFPIVYHPEFLREGSAVSDFFENPQIVAAPVAGIDDIGVKKLFKKIYKNIKHRFYCTDAKTAEMIKYLNNTYHALKVVFSNEVSRICTVKNINTHDLFKIFMEDYKLNISRAYLTPGFAYGGSCLSKDVRGLTTLARHSNIDMPIIMNIERSNELHIEFAFQQILAARVTRIGFYGLSFKPKTDDVRESSYVKLFKKLIGEGKDIKIYDESLNMNNILGKNLEYLLEHIPHISQHLIGNIDELIDFSEMIVLCHYNKKIVDIFKSSDSKILVDITGKLTIKDLSNNIKSLMVHDPMNR